MRVPVKLAVYAGAVFWALFALGMGHTAFAGPNVDAVAASLTVVSAALGALSLHVAHRLDRITFLKFVSLIGLVVALIVGAVAHESESIGGTSIALGVAGGLLALFGAIQLLRHDRTADPVPDVLRGMFPEPNIVERDGVQIVGTIASVTLAPGGLAEVRVHLQNCWDGVRRVRVGLEPTRSPFRGRGSIAANGPLEVELGPCEVGHVALACRASDDARGDFSIWLAVRVCGSQGERARRRGAQELSVRWPWWFTILALPWGIVYGGGARLRVRVAPGEAASTTGEMKPAEWTSVWRKEGG